MTWPRSPSYHVARPGCLTSCPYSRDDEALLYEHMKLDLIGGGREEEWNGLGWHLGKNHMWGQGLNADSCPPQPHRTRSSRVWALGIPMCHQHPHRYCNIQAICLYYDRSKAWGD